MKRQLLDFANSLIRFSGVQLYREGFDMESVLKQISSNNPEINSVFDLGAARGKWSEVALKYFPKANFLGVDPLQEREPYLKRLKAKSSRFDYIMCVAGEEDGGTTELAVTGDLDGSFVGNGGGNPTREVPVHSMDALVDKYELKGPFFLKFDTHGFEVPILKGAEKTLEQTSYIVMEAYNYRHTDQTLLFHEMCALMETKGFRCFNMVDLMQRHGDKSLWQMDLFFARDDNPVFDYNSFRPD